jgi:hypothetical protein
MGDHAGLVLEDYPRFYQLIADSIRFGKVLALSRFNAARDELLDFRSSHCSGAGGERVLLSRVNQLGRGASIMMAEDHAAPGACCS